MASTDLQSDLESLLHAVWQEEVAWRFSDKIDLALGLPPVRRTGPIDGPSWTPPATT